MQGNLVVRAEPDKSIYHFCLQEVNQPAQFSQEDGCLKRVNCSRKPKLCLVNNILASLTARGWYMPPSFWGGAAVQQIQIHMGGPSSYW